MKRSMCGIVVLAAATALWSCNGDPTTDIQGSSPRILADPSSLFLGEGESKFVELQILDEQGNQEVVNFSAQNVGPGITVVLDTTFLETTIGTHLETAQRFVVTGNTPAASSFEVVSGGLTDTIPVNVLPASFAPTFSSVAPAQNEPVTLTAPAGFTFGADATVVFGADTAITTSVAADGSTITFVPRPALAAGAPVVPIVTGARSALYSTVPLSIPTVDSLTLPLAAPVAGTAAASSAPAIAAPAVGQSVGFFDLPDFVAAPDRFYRIDVAEAGDYTITVDWNIGADLDLFLCQNDPGCTSASATANFFAATASHPESGTLTLPVGSHFLGVEDFGGDAIGTLISIRVTRL